MEQKLTTVQKERFNQEHCKIRQNQKSKDKQLKRARDLEYAAHQELLDDEMICSREHCQECNNVLC